jgi:hypothetical protein
LVTYKSFATKAYAHNEAEWQQIALAVFHFQAEHCAVYRDYLTYLGRNPASVRSIEQIPFLPIGLFKSHAVKSGAWEEEVVFTSSGTTGAITSRHAIPDRNFYLDHAQRLFEAEYGPLTGYHVLALLPSYLERRGSSLIAMADHFIRESKSDFSGFYLKNLDALDARIRALLSTHKRVLLLGVTFALLDLAERIDEPYGTGLIVMETGGMKGRRPEITRSELHAGLMAKFGVPAIHSEYGMTELLSQAYSHGAGVFKANPSLRVLIRDVTSPLELLGFGETGGVNVIDLANAHGCSFIETSDLGKLHENQTFEILGRMDNSDVRGCNLLVQ